MFVFRKKTERPEAVRAGFSKLVGIEVKKILDEVRIYKEKKVSFSRGSPYGNGTAGEQIVNILMEYGNK